MSVVAKLANGMDHVPVVGIGRADEAEWGAQAVKGGAVYGAPGRAPNGGEAQPIPTALDQCETEILAVQSRTHVCGTPARGERVLETEGSLPGADINSRGRPALRGRLAAPPCGANCAARDLGRTRKFVAFGVGPGFGGTSSGPDSSATADGEQRKLTGRAESRTLPPRMLRPNGP